MKKITTIISVLLSVAMLTSSIYASQITAEPIAPVTPVETYGFSEKVVNFLEEHNVDFDEIYNAALPLNTEYTYIDRSIDAWNDNIESLMRDSMAYDFTDEQINDYVLGLKYTPVTTMNETSTLSISSTFESNNNFQRIDNAGIGYEVFSKQGYCESTTFATLPTIQNFNSNSPCYMMFSVASDYWGMDVGLVYTYDDYGNIGWKLCATESPSTTYPNGRWFASPQINSNLVAGLQVYMKIRVLEDGDVWFRVLNATDLETPYFEYTFDVGAYSTFTQNNTGINRQITLCDAKEIKTFDSTTRVVNAIFNDSYIYKLYNAGQTNEYVTWDRTTSANCLDKRLGAFGAKISTNEDGSIETNIDKVVVNDHSPWYFENITLSFN